MSQYRTSYLGGGVGPDCGEGFYDSLRQFWQSSYDGAFFDDYSEGYDAGKADLAAGTYTYLDGLRGVERDSRDTGWNAKLDGYREATKERGPIRA